MEFRVLGLLAVVDNGRPVTIGRGKESALLALLLLHANQPVSVDRLIDELWEQRPPENAGKAVQIYISRLRARLGRERIVTTSAGYVLRVEPGELDARRFEQLAEEGQNELETGNPADAEAMLSEALDLWHGQVFAEFRFDVFAQAEIRRLEELHSSTVAGRVDARLALGQAEQLIPELKALVREQPLWERPRRQLMLALYQAGRQAEALALYQSTRKVLDAELGVEPGPDLQALERAILNQAPELERSTRPSSRNGSEDVGEAPAAARDTFVGREGELKALTAGLEDVLTGRGRLFLLVGEPGIGKSRLAEELIRHARGLGVRVLVGRCWEAGGAPAFWPWVQSLRAYVREAEPEALRRQLGAGAGELAQILPELRKIFAGLPEPAALESEGARFRLFEATAEFLRSASAEQPILLVLDDLHAADTPSLLLLQFLARELGSTRVLLLGALRDVDPIARQALTAMLTEVAREPLTTRLQLAGLSERDVKEYVERAASEIVSPELVAALHEETEGNPLFVSEAVRLLAVEGLWQEATAATIVIPQSVRDVIARRLTHLSEECNRVLVLASVLGREFALAAVARVSGVSEDQLLELLDEAMAVRVISDVPGGPGRLRFAHILIRDTLYEGLTTARRLRLHRQAAEALESLYGAEPGPHMTELAHHAIAGSDFDKGVRYARRAGDRAFELLAYEEAARLYGTAVEALDLAGLPDEKRRCALLLSLGEAESRAGNASAAKKSFSEAAGIARRIGLPRELAGAAAGYAGRIVWARAGVDDRLVPLLEEGLAALGEGDVELRVRLLSRLAGALRDEHSRDRRDSLSREAVEVARRAESPIALAYALEGRAAAMFGHDNRSELLALGSELRALAERIGDPERVVQAHIFRFMAQLELGNIFEGQVDLDAAARIAEDLRQPAQLWLIASAQAMLALAHGWLDAADKLVHDAFVLGEGALPESAIPVFRLQQYALADFRGKLEEIEPGIIDLVAAYPARTVFRCVLAHLRARLGRLVDARRGLEELAPDGFSAIPFDQEWLFGMSLLAETSALLHDLESATVLRRLLAPWAAFNVTDLPEGIRGSVGRYLGILATTTEHWSEAAQHFEDALGMNERMGARPWLARTQHDFARMLFARGEAADRKRAQGLLDQALLAFRELGMEADEPPTCSSQRVRSRRRQPGPDDR